ncbi:MAG: aspartate/glutamate racemase family protein [Candidatus Aminicenantia bacterium]
MKNIGILGGLGPESTIEYYRIITSLCREKGMGYNYPIIIIYSVNFQELTDLMKSGNLPELINKISEGIHSLHNAGADFALIAANTPHMIFDEVAVKSSIPLLSIIEETAKAAKNLKLNKLGLFGTKYTMEMDFYKKIFLKYNMEIIVPEKKDQQYIHQKIMDELVVRNISNETRQKLLEIAPKLINKENIEGLILGCTELPLIISKDIVPIPVFDTTRIHAEAALNYSLQE